MDQRIPSESRSISVSRQTIEDPLPEHLLRQTICDVRPVLKRRMLNEENIEKEFRALEGEKALAV